MSRLIQPLGEHFLYCSPERMNRELYRLRPAVTPGYGRKPKKNRGSRLGQSKTG